MTCISATEVAGYYQIVPSGTTNTPQPNIWKANTSTIQNTQNNDRAEVFLGCHFFSKNFPQPSGHSLLRLFWESELLLSINYLLFVGLRLLRLLRGTGIWVRRGVGFVRVHVQKELIIPARMTMQLFREITR